MHKTRILGVIILGLIFVTLESNATAAEVSGFVKDSAGATLLDARVLLVSLSSLETKTAEIREAGRFQFLDLPAGDYALVVVSPKHTPCFKPVIRQFNVTRNGTAKIPIEMHLDTERCGGIVN